MRSWACCLVLFVFSVCVDAGITFGDQFGTPHWRWDAASLIHNSPDGMIERSLFNGIRYSVEGGSYASLYSQITWTVSTPTVTQFEQAVKDAFNIWLSIDPVSGLGTTLSFTEDLGTAVNTGTSSGLFSNLRLGSEIDIFVEEAPGGLLASGTGLAQVSALGVPLTLTSGVTGYNSFAISGADIHLSETQQTLDTFRLLLTHELGHALGLADVELANSAMIFRDDNYDPTNSATAENTLTNSWIHLVDPLDPDNSAGLSLFTVANGDPGIDTPNVDILMESNDAGGLPAMLHNDDFGMRQFLYPVAIPEPSSMLLTSLAALVVLAKYRV